MKGNDFPSTNDADVLLGLYSAIGEPDNYWAAIDILRKIGNEQTGQMTEKKVQVHAQRLQNLIENLLETSPKNDELQHQWSIKFNQHGKIDAIGECIGGLLAQEPLLSIWDLPFYGDDAGRVKRLLKNDSVNPVVIILPNIAEKGSHLARFTADVKTGWFVLQVVKLELAAGAKKVFAENFSVSDAQFRVLEYLVAGYSVDTIATNLNRSVETVRSHIKALSQKLAVRSQAELVSRSLSVPVGSTDGPSHLQEPGNILITGSDGDQVQYISNGDHSGKTILYFQQAIDGPYVTEKFHTELKNAGLNLISIARPGAGGTDRNKQTWPSYLRSSVEAHNRVLESLGLESKILLSVGTGLPHALAYAEKYAPEASILALNPFPPFVNKSVCNGLPGRWRGYASLVHRAPFLLQTVILLAYRLFSINPRKQAERVIRDEVPNAIDPLIREDIVATLEKNLTINAINRAQHFVEEAGVMRRDWCKDARELCPKVKIFLVQGTGKFSIAPDLFEKLSRELPNAKARTLDKHSDPIHYLESSWVCNKFLGMLNEQQFKK